MKRLYSYVIKSFIGPFVMTFCICVFFLIMQFVWKYLDELVGKGLENSVLIELFSYAAITTIPMALPLAVLLASIMTFGTLGERFELIAMKASGISLLKVMRPLIYLNIAITIFAFVLADQIIPAVNLKFVTLLVSVREQRPEMIVKEGVFSNEIDGMSIKVNRRNLETNALLDIMIYDHREHKGNTDVTIADSGFLNMSDDKQFMILTLYNGEKYLDTKPVERGSKNTYPFQRNKFEKETVVINVKNFEMKRTNENYFKGGFKMLKNSQIITAVDSFQNRYDDQVKQIALSITYNETLDSKIRTTLLKKDSLKVNISENVDVSPAEVSFDSIYSRLDAGQKRSVLGAALRKAQANQRTILQYQTEMYARMESINKHMIEWHKKYTLSLACLLFFFIGAPLGAIIRKGGFGMPVVISILMFIAYYLVSVIGEKVAREGVFKVNMVLWFSTVVFLVIGVLLTHQAVTDSFLLNKETYNRIINRLNIFNYFSKKKKNENTVSNQ